MNENSGDVGNQDVNKTVFFDDNNIKSGKLKIVVEGYPLKEDDFDTLVNSGTGLHEWSIRFLLITIGGVVMLIAKSIGFFINFSSIKDKNNITLEINNYEWISILISLLLCVIFIILEKLIKNKKDKLIRKIKEFFISAKND
jgi:hypothetical protein